MTAYRSNRKTTPKVRDGQVQKKNRHAPTRFKKIWHRYCAEFKFEPKSSP